MKIVYIILGIFTIQMISAQSLEDYLKMAETNHPEIEFHELNYNIASERIGETGNLDDTKFSLGYFVSPPETRVGAQRIKIGVQQSFPWPGTFQAQKNLAKIKANEKAYDIDIAKQNLFYKIKDKFFDLYENAATLNILKENKEILLIYEKMALGALENNKARMSDVLKIRIQKNELHSKIYSNFNDKITMSNHFNRLINRDENAIINIVDSLSVLDIILLDNEINAHPEFRKIDARIKTVLEEKELLEFEKKPRFTVTIDYINVDKRLDQNVNDNGKDILMPMLGMSIPIFTKKYEAKNSRLDLNIKKIEVERYNKEQMFKDQLDLAQSNLNNAILKVVAAQKNKDQIQRAINSDLKAYETGTLDYDNILRMQLQKIKYQVMEIQGIKNAYNQKAIIEYLLDVKR